MVLIVGAGPVGLTLAASLRRLGVPVRIVDTQPARTDKSKALVVWSRTLELLDIEADGCADAFIAAGLEGTGARMFANGRELFHVDLAAAPSRYNFALLLPQSETERLLEARLAALGVAVERQATLTTFVDHGDGVTATLQRASGETEDVECAYLCGCDGAHSTVRHGLGMDFEGDAMPGSWLLADVHLAGDVARRELTLAFTDDGAFALFPIVGDRFRVLASVPDTAGDAPPTLADVQAIVDARAPVPLVASDPVWLSRFRINERKVRDYGRARVLLAGDAAHIHSPAGGQGMNTGMQDAFNLAWKLALVLDGRAVPALVDTYSAERSPVGDAVLRSTGRLTEVALVRNPVLQGLRALVAALFGHIPAAREHMVGQLTELDIAYPGSPLTGARSGTQPAPGERAEDVPVRDAQGKDTRLHALLREGRFVLLSSTPAVAPVPEEVRGLVQPATTGSDRYTPLHVFLVRPDAYVSASGTPGEVDAMLAVVRRFAVAGVSPA